MVVERLEETPKRIILLIRQCSSFGMVERIRRNTAEFIFALIPERLGKRFNDEHHTTPFVEIHPSLRCFFSVPGTVPNWICISS
jgi:hypothetical protein